MRLAGPGQGLRGCEKWRRPSHGEDAASIVKMPHAGDGLPVGGGHQGDLLFLPFHLTTAIMAHCSPPGGSGKAGGSEQEGLGFFPRL